MKIHRNFSKSAIIVMTALSFLCGSCIHEYPKATNSNIPGNNPETFQINLEISFKLQWYNIAHNIDFPTKADADILHRFTVEVREGDKVVSHENHYLSDNEFSSGTFIHKLSEPLKRGYYNLAVWYDFQNNGESPYDVSNLNNVRLTSFPTSDVQNLQCAYSTDILDLRTQDKNDSGSIIKKIELDWPAARFEIIATDILDFIAYEKEALNQGETYRINVSFSSGAYETFNPFTNELWNSGEKLAMEGRMRLPFDDYTELKIAEGLFFCAQEEEVTARISIINSSLFTVSQTEYFRFPVKRGHITTVKGDFLVFPIDGIFSIDNIWEGIIEY